MNEDRFFVYSRDNQKPIRMIVQDERGQLRYINIRALHWNTETLWYLPNSTRAKNAKSISRERILSVSYARGDSGESDCLKGFDDNEQE